MARIKATRRELERLWRDRPCLQPNHKLGIVKLTPELKKRGGYWILEGFKLVMKRGKKYPAVRSKFRGPAPYLTADGWRFLPVAIERRDRDAVKAKLTVVLT